MIDMCRGRRRSTIEVVEDVIKHHARFDEFSEKMIINAQHAKQRLEISHPLEAQEMS